METKALTNALDRVCLLATAGCFKGLSDGALLDRCVTGQDEAAFAALVERHGPMVYGVCSRILHDPHDVEDACQATFMVFLGKASRIRKQSSVASWLHGVARRVSLTSLRERIARRCREQQRPASEPTPASDDLTWSEVQAALDEELERLPGRFQSPLILCYLEGKTRDEAAAALGITPGRLHGLLQRGRDLLRKRLVERGVAIGAGLLGAEISGGVCKALPPTLAIRVVNGAVAALTGRESGSVLAGTQTAFLTNEVLRAMYYAKLKTVFMCVGIVCTLMIGAMLASGFAQSEGPPNAHEPILASEPMKEAPKNPANALTFRKVVSVTSENKDDFKYAVIAVSMDQKSLFSRNYIVSKGPEEQTTGAQLWDLQPKMPKRTRIGDGTNFGFVPNSNLAYYVTWGKGVQFWDTRSHAKIGDPLPHALREDSTLSPAVSPGGEFMVTRSELDHLQFWDLRIRKPITPEIAQQGMVGGMRFSSDGKWFFSQNYNRKLTVWDPKAGKLAAGPFRHDLIGGNPAYSPKTQQLTTFENNDQNEDVWRSEGVLRSGKEWNAIRRIALIGHARDASWIDETHLLVVADEKLPGRKPPFSYGRNVVYLVSLENEKPDIQILTRDRWIAGTVVAPDGKHFITRTPHGTSCWKLGSKEPIFTKPGDHVVAFSAGDWVLFHQRAAIVYSLTDGKELLRKNNVDIARAQGPNIWLCGEEGVEVWQAVTQKDK